MATQEPGQTLDRFRKKLLSLMDGKTIGDFALACGINRSNLSRLLQDGNQQRPSPKTLRRIADFTNADYEELLMLCGYTDTLAAARRSQPLMERLRLDAADMDKGFAELSGKAVLYDSIEDYLDMWNTLYGNGDCRITISREHEYEGDRQRFAEQYVTLHAVLTGDEGICHLYAVVYYVRTLGGKVCVVGHALDGESLLEVNVLTPKELRRLGLDKEEVARSKIVYAIEAYAETKLLRAIFGEGDHEAFRSVTEGFGFYVDTVSTEKLQAFLAAHADTVPDMRNGILAYTGGQTRAVMFGGRAANPMCVAAKIMSVETGLPFNFYREETVYDESFPPCIMCEGAIPMKTVGEMAARIRPYAMQLGVARYGQCFAGVLLREKDCLVYATDEELSADEVTTDKLDEEENGNGEG